MKRVERVNVLYLLSQPSSSQVMEKPNPMAYEFEILIPPSNNLAELLDKAQKLTTEQGGLFIGTLPTGEFTVDGVTATYTTVQNKITFLITDKPWFATYSMIEKAIRSFFGL